MENLDSLPHAKMLQESALVKEIRDAASKGLTGITYPK